MRKLLYALPVLMLLLLSVAPAHAWTGNLDGRVVFGQSFTLQSGQILDGDLVVFGGEAVIEENATVRGNVVVIGGSLTLDGSATGDAVVIGGLMTMGAKSSVVGNVTTVGGSLQRAAGAQVGGQIVTNIPSPNVQTPITPGVPSPQPNIAMGLAPVWRAFGVLGTAVIFAALAMLLVIFLQPQLDRVAQAIVAEPVIAGGIGLLATFVSPVALVILVVILILTLILIPVAVLAVIAWAVLIVLAWLFGIIALGMEVGERFTQAIHQSWAPVLSAGLGTFLLMFVVGAFGLVPCVGGIAEFLIGMVAIGAAVMTLFGSRPMHRPGLTAASPPAAAGGNPPLPPPS
ncbi:MAG TPA: polymer-forming cytoskeletal protein [Anaerolineales bacterium]|nr:polymer-forming cytoskeletal protein [Anaerolineales bacterium]